MIEYLRERRILLPAAVTLEKIALATRALARKRAHKSLVEGLSPETIAGLEALLVVADDEDRTPLAWLREWPEAPRQRNLVELVERFKPCASSASEPTARSAFTARATRQSPAKSRS